MTINEGHWARFAAAVPTAACLSLFLMTAPLSATASADTDRGSHQGSKTSQGAHQDSKTSQGAHRAGISLHSGGQRSSLAGSRTASESSDSTTSMRVQPGTAGADHVSTRDPGSVDAGQVKAFTAVGSSGIKRPQRSGARSGAGGAGEVAGAGDQPEPVTSIHAATDGVVSRQPSKASSGRMASSVDTSSVSEDMGAETAASATDSHVTSPGTATKAPVRDTSVQSATDMATASALSAREATPVRVSSTAVNESATTTPMPTVNVDSAPPAALPGAVPVQVNDDGTVVVPTVDRELKLSWSVYRNFLGLPSLFKRTPGQFGTSAVNTEEPPQVADAVQTPYGEIGKWMINSDGTIANWLGQEQEGRTIHEPVNVVLVDRSSKTIEEARENLLNTLSRAGFPSLPLHSSTGYNGILAGSVYAQYPGGARQVFSDGAFFSENNHARVFGPAPAELPDGSGYVWSASVSRETGSLDRRGMHQYVTFEGSEAALAQGLLDAGAQRLPTPTPSAPATTTAKPPCSTSAALCSLRQH